ncbi:hypothetical protein BZA05DRAFT_428110 [Tricharina praecox]|uniref:uncharacterized protein n=1 Tax=Tricharina praecox TaxID=43433 RepID=UPI0022212A33|nr:uncharacterized protein BZA05DRAFT_428110 [Tricharina praecox]KAI5858938.1 hypothetical protein BZA05DRAFT_428110 [Tricharina praecox]
MFNFTGSARRPRNVNLSGRKPTTPSTSTSQKNKVATSSSLQTAREERAAREAERKRLKAAGTIQRTWRGRKAAEQQRKEWRAVWDEYPADASHAPTRISLFLAFMDMGRKCQPKTWSRDDLKRLSGMLLVTRLWLSSDGDDGCDPQRRRYLLRMLGRLLVEGIDSGAVKDEALERTLQVLPSLTWNVPELVDDRYYTALSKETASPNLHDSRSQALVEAVVAPLRLSEGRSDADVDAAYKAFNAGYLITPDLVSLLGDRCIKNLIAGVDLRKVTEFFSMNLETESKLWLLSHVVHFSRLNKNFIDLTTSGLSADREEYIKFLSMALSSVAVEVGQRIDVEDVTMNDGEGSDAEDEGTSSKRTRVKKQPLPPFVKQQIESLVQQSSVTSLLSNTKSTDGNVDILAGFALTLLLVFPARRTDMRFWLCVALTADGVPAVKYVWNAVKKCQLFTSIKRDSRVAVDPLKYPPTLSRGMSVKSIEDQWNLIFLFLEMYSFVLVTGDDHEFVQGKGRQLALSEVGELALFLKNLSFATYYWYGEIMGEDPTKDTGGEVFFKPRENGRAWELNYFRSVVTDVLKAIYTRDSRRHFLPKDFWLMGKYLTLDGFIAAVVQEEENRLRHRDGESEDEDDGDYRIDPDSREAMDPATRHHAEHARREKALKKKQRANYRAVIESRSEILQNLPFTIPFDKRVEIFREFVSKDQTARRNGHTDPDLWRFSVMNGAGVDGDRLSKHKATIRRKHEFQDAYNAFWKLGEGLKEPIQIKYMDRFGAEEAGIDGGGVTKEFLTGVCGEAFSPSADVPDDNNPNEDPEDFAHYGGISLTTLGVNNMFKENPEHLLYPNPTMLEEVKHKLRQFLITDNRSVITDILHRYEFCGRILGKCLYEGILVDLSFAPFFLLKWSQPSSASAVGVNDLRDLDAEMYRHLMALMDFEGNVETTFNLDFTITTQIAPGKIETYNLKPNGDSIPVTNANRLEYVHLVSKHRLVKEPAAQTAAFLKGLTTIINPHWLKMFNQSELQTLVGGDTGSPIDVEDLRRNTIYGGVYSIGDDGEEHETIRLFWQVMHELDDADRRKVLRFVTSVARAPLLGFRVLRPRFSIRDAGEDQARLCSASTCVNLLKLPRYKSARTLRKKLLYSVRSNAGFDLS